MFGFMYCLVAGHVDQHVRNLVHPEFLLQESLWRCAMCERAIVLAGWQPETPPQTPVETLAIDADVPALTDTESGQTVA